MLVCANAISDDARTIVGTAIDAAGAGAIRAFVASIPETCYPAATPMAP